jgi:hypothetical protein
MTHFRSKLAVLLVDSELNDDNIRNTDLVTTKSGLFGLNDKCISKICIVVDFITLGYS